MRKPPRQGPISEGEAAALLGALDAVPALLLAVSGGPDSTALMWLAARWRNGLQLPPKLVAVTVDHGLRKGAAREALAVKKLAAKLNVPHETLRWTGHKPKTGIQEAARNARYRLLAQAARAVNATHLLTAHTLDDQAETVLFRLARGSGVSGLAAMSRTDAVPVAEGTGLHLVRPLLGVPKARLIATLKAAKIAYAIDPSNSDPRFARPRFRKLMPLLAREGLTAERLARLASRAQQVEDTLFEVVNDVQARLWPGPWSPEEAASLDAKAFNELPEELALRLLQRMVNLIGNEGPAELGQLETLYVELKRACGGFLAGDGGNLRRTLAGAMVTLAGNRLSVERAPPRNTRKPLMEAPFTKARRSDAV
jgi:tRNA(Ile)-lysidine synthase